MNLSFAHRIENWPSSTRAEIIAILSALVVIPPYSTVKIYTDSQAALQGLELILSSSPHLAKTRFKKNNQITWSIIEEIINTNYLEVIGIKVKGHDKDPERLPYNDKADSLAKSGAELIHFNITTSSYRSSVFKYIPCFDGEHIERNISHFIKNCYQTYIHYELTSLNRFTDILPLFTSATIRDVNQFELIQTNLSKLPSFEMIILKNAINKVCS